MDMFAGYRPPAPAGEHHLIPPTATVLNRWLLLLLPAAGGLFSGWLVYTYAPEAEGHGTDAAIDSFHNGGGFIRGRVPFIKTLASAITLTTGGSGGREGPIAQIGAGFGSFLATRLKMTDRDRRIMMAAGVGAGVGSIFRAPLAGALFAAEVLYRDPEFESDVIIPAGISSVVAYCIFCLVFGWGSLFSSKGLRIPQPFGTGSLSGVGHGSRGHRRILRQIFLRHHRTVSSMVHSESYQTGHRGAVHRRHRLFSSPVPGLWLRLRPDGAEQRADRSVFTGPGHRQNPDHLFFHRFRRKRRGLRPLHRHRRGHGRGGGQHLPPDRPRVGDRTGGLCGGGDGRFFYGSFQYPHLHHHLRQRDDQFLPSSHAEPGGLFRLLSDVSTVDHLLQPGPEQGRLIGPCRGLFCGYSPEHPCQRPDGPGEKGRPDSPEHDLSRL